MQQGSALARLVFAVSLLAAIPGSAAVTASPRQTPANPLVGAWRLNVDRTRYGASAERRLQETFVCEERADDVVCRIQGVRADGRNVRAEFRAAPDGRARAVTGMSDIDQVTLRRAGEGALDATFSYQGTPVFGYRAFRSEDGKSLSILSVAPVSRVALTTLVSYDRQ